MKEKICKKIKKVGKLKTGQAVYRDKDDYSVETDFRYLVTPTKEELEEIKAMETRK